MIQDDFLPLSGMTAQADVNKTTRPLPDQSSIGLFALIIFGTVFAST